MGISIYSIFNWITGAIICSSAIALFYLGKRSLSARLFTIIAITYSLWIFLIAEVINIPNLYIHQTMIEACHFLGTMIATLFLIISISYPHNNRISNKLLSSLIFIELLFAYLIFVKHLVIASSVSHVLISYLCWSYGPLISVFDIYFAFCWIFGIVILTKKWQKELDTAQKNNLRRVLIAFTIGIIPPTITTIIMPQMGIFSLYWLSPLSGIVWIIIIAYAISKYHLFDIKVLAIQVATFTLWIFILIRIFLANSSQEMIIESGIFIISLIIGIIIMRYAIFENKQKEAVVKLANELTTLNSTLAEKVAEQTAEIRKAYELEKHARRELEKLNETKDQFIMITQHHLRAPVTRIKDNLSTTLSGDFGRVSAKLRNTLRETANSATRLGKIVDDFLDITTLKAGGNILNIDNHNLKPLVEDVLAELRLDIEKMQLTINLAKDDEKDIGGSHGNVWPDLQIDASKMREVLLIILENAVKYNVDGGTIDITTDSKDDYFEIVVSNTGFGLTSEDRDKLFNHHYYRSVKARSVNPIGMGIGLSVARAIVRAHKGLLEICSREDGKGVLVRMKVSISI